MHPWSGILVEENHDGIPHALHGQGFITSKLARANATDKKQHM